jgi:hypothetical protein
MRLKWETSSNEVNANHIERASIQTTNPVGVAELKARDIALVRAAFQGTWTGFEPYVRLWVKDGKNATGLTVLIHSYPRDYAPNPLPDVCIRRAEWHGQSAVDGFVEAHDKRLYLLDQLPLECVLRFYRSAEIEIDHLMQRTSTLLAGGVSFLKDHRSELDHREVHVGFCDGLLSYEFSYSASSVSSDTLEKLVHDWLQYARSLQLRDDCPPDDGFEVAYRESLWERIARY